MQNLLLVELPQVQLVAGGVVELVEAIVVLVVVEVLLVAGAAVSVVEQVVIALAEVAEVAVMALVLQAEVAVSAVGVVATTILPQFMLEVVVLDLVEGVEVLQLAVVEVVPKHILLTPIPARVDWQLLSLAVVQPMAVEVVGVEMVWLVQVLVVAEAMAATQLALVDRMPLGLATVLS